MFKDTNIVYDNKITIKVFPNQAHDHIIIDNGNGNCNYNYNALAGYSIKIYNSLGQILYSTLINQQQFSIDLSTWNGNGLYYVNIIDAQGHIIDIKKVGLQ